MPDGVPKRTDAAAQRRLETAEIASERIGLVRVGVVAALAGVLTGLVGAAFRLVLGRAELLRIDLVRWTAQFGMAGVLVPVTLVATCAVLARLLVRYAPEAAGSGVQRVEAVMRGEAFPARLRVLPVKFIGGVLALGSGLALGREGPTVQMGAVIGARLARLMGLAEDDVRSMSAAVGGAGLGVAFSAPTGGAIFTFEEVRRVFTFRLVVMSLLACAAASGVTFVLLGDLPDFRVAPPAMMSWTSIVPVLLLGLLLGAMGVGYNWLTILLLEFSERRVRVLPEVRAGAIGAIVGLILWLSPHLVGGGDYLSQQALDRALPIGSLALILAVRWLLGPLCYAAGTPGGLFAPLLLVGASTGALFASVCNHSFGFSLDTIAFSIIGMATFFAAVVRAPFTGIMLIVEMTATTTQLTPMLAAAGVAVAAATAMGGLPIYDTLRLRMLERASVQPAHPVGSGPAG